MVNGKDVFMTTSNGTRAIESSANGSKKLFIACFLNIESVVNKLIEENQEVYALGVANTKNMKVTFMENHSDIKNIDDMPYADFPLYPSKKYKPIKEILKELGIE